MNKIKQCLFDWIYNKIMNSIKLQNFVLSRLKWKYIESDSPIFVYDESNITKYFYHKSKFLGQTIDLIFFVWKQSEKHDIQCREFYTHFAKKII